MLCTWRITRLALSQWFHPPVNVPIGDYDDALDHGGGHDLELSLRAWMCGGSVKIARCSRVAVHNALKPNTAFGETNIRRITELWLDGYKHFVYTQTGMY